MADYFFGIDLGSSFTKLCVIDSDDKVQFKTVFPTLSRNRNKLQENLDFVYENFAIQSRCATGYGRVTFTDCDVKKTELICSAVGASKDFPYRKTVIDIGGEDIKIIACDGMGKVEHFHMNDKCAAGTGAFIMEVAEKAELGDEDMSRLAQASNSIKELNSFCTVFSKTEILQWKFSGVSPEDMAKGIYLSIVNRIARMSYDRNLPVILCGGVIDFHPYISEILKERLPMEIHVPEDPQYISAYGAALIAMREADRLKSSAHLVSSAEG